MAERFRLETLERLRTATLEERGRALHAASLALASGRAAHASLVEAMAGAMTPAFTTPDGVSRAAHYRERLRIELQAAADDVTRLERELGQARLAWLEARAQLKAVTVLHDRHRAKIRADEARREQLELDDLAGSRRRRVTASTGEVGGSS